VTAVSCSVNLFTYRQQTERWTHSSGDNVSCSQGCFSNYELRRPYQLAYWEYRNTQSYWIRNTTVTQILHHVNKGL